MLQRTLQNYLAPALWLFAFICALMPFETYEAQSFMLSILLLSGAIITTLFTNPIVFNIQNPGFLFLGGAFWALALLSSILSSTPYVSFIYFYFFSALPFSFFFLQLTSQKDLIFKILAIGGCAIFTALSLSTFVQYFWIKDIFFKGSVHWPLANPNSLAAILSLGFFCSLGIALSAQKYLQRYAALLLSLLLISSILMTGSRGALIALVTAFLIFCALMPAQIKKNWRPIAILLISSGTSLLLLNFYGEKSALLRLIATFSGETPALYSRPEIWASTWDIIKDNFWIGTGIGTFFLHYPEYRGNDLRSAGLMAHNDPLQFWSEMGIFAPILFYILIALAIFKTIKSLLKLSPNDNRRIQILTPFCALGAMIAHAHFTFNFNVLSILTLSGVLLSYWLYALNKIDERPPVILHHLALSSTAIKTAIILPLIAGLILFTSLQSSEILTNRAMNKMLSGDIEGFSTDINQAGKLSHNKNARTLMLAASVPMSILETQKALLSQEEQKKLFKQADKLLEKAKTLNPRLASLYFQQARLLKNAAPEAQGQQRLKILLKQALKTDPLHLESRRALAQLYKEQGEKEQALEILKAGMKWPYAQQNPISYYQDTATLALEMNNRKLQEEALKKLLLYKKDRK